MTKKIKEINKVQIPAEDKENQREFCHRIKGTATNKIIPK